MKAFLKSGAVLSVDTGQFVQPYVRYNTYDVRAIDSAKNAYCVTCRSVHVFS